jgi:uncharacterized protein (TIGR03435 family)
LAQARIIDAYHLRDPRILNTLIAAAPKWIPVDWLDIQAKMSESNIRDLSKLDARQKDTCERQFTQSWLTDRFQLSAHLVTRDTPADELVVASPSKMHLKAAAPGQTEHVDRLDTGDGQYHEVPIDPV